MNNSLVALYSTLNLIINDSVTENVKKLFKYSLSNFHSSKKLEVS